MTGLRNFSRMVKHLSKSNLVLRSILAFVMIPMLQRELDEFKDNVWNSHRIHLQKEALIADGIPNHIVEFREKYGMEREGNTNL